MRKNKQIFTNHWTSIFYNPLFLIRVELYNELEKSSNNLSGKLLDFGCGSKPYKHLFNNVNEYIGLDFANDRVKGEDTKTDLEYDGSTIPAANNQFDCVLSTEVFEHLFDLNGALKEIHRVLKPDGVILFTCPFSFGEHEAPYDYARYTTFALKSIMKENNFEVVEFKKTGTNISVIIQYIGMYIYYFIGRWQLTRYLLFPILISPIFILNNVLHFILPKKVLRNDIYMNNVFLCKKLTNETNQ